MTTTKPTTRTDPETGLVWYGPRYQGRQTWQTETGRLEIGQPVPVEVDWAQFRAVMEKLRERG